MHVLLRQLSNLYIAYLVSNIPQGKATVLGKSIGNVISADQLTAKSICNLCINFIIKLI